MIENDKFRNIMADLGMDLETVEQESAERIERDEILRGILDGIKSRCLITVLGCCEEEIEENQNAYFLMRQEMHFDTLLKEKVDLMPDELEEESAQRAKEDVTREYAFQGAIVEAIEDALYDARHQHIDNPTLTKNFALAVILCQLDRVPGDPKITSYIDLYNELVDGESLDPTSKDFLFYIYLAIEVRDANGAEVDSPSATSGN